MPLVAIATLSELDHGPSTAETIKRLQKKYQPYKTIGVAFHFFCLPKRHALFIAHKTTRPLKAELPGWVLLGPGGRAGRSDEKKKQSSKLKAKSPEKNFHNQWGKNQYQYLDKHPILNLLIARLSKKDLDPLHRSIAVSGSCTKGHRWGAIECPLKTSAGGRSIRKSSCFGRIKKIFKLLVQSDPL